MHELRLLAINLTERCNLGCAHCYLDAGLREHGDVNELTVPEIDEVFAAISARPETPMVVLTGGEPLMRRDLDEIVAAGSARGLAIVVGTNGMLLSERRVTRLKQAGALGVGISIDSLDPRVHDEFRGRPGSWARTMAGIDNCRRQNLSFQIHFTVTERNATEIAAMADFSRDAGARVLNIFFLICTGRAESLSDISPGRYDEVLAQVLELQERHPELIIRARCAPQFKRIAHQRRPATALNRISGADGDGCIAGTHYCRITARGGVTPCPYMQREAGNIREQSFAGIWRSGTDFERLRKPKLGGKCGRCEYRQLCGGCRARPLAAGDDLMDADSSCGYVPVTTTVIAPFQDPPPGAIRWSDEASKRLARIPSFVRGLVRKRAEAYVGGLGESLITPEHLAVLSARRFGGKPPMRPPTTGGRGHS